MVFYGPDLQAFSTNIAYIFLRLLDMIAYATAPDSTSQFEEKGTTTIWNLKRSEDSVISAIA